MAAAGCSRTRPPLPDSRAGHHCDRRQAGRVRVRRSPHCFATRVTSTRPGKRRTPMTQSRFSRSARTMLYAVFALSTVGLPVTASALDLTGHWQSVSLNCRGIDSSGHHTGEMVASDLAVSQVAGSDEIRVLNRSVEYYGLA